MVLESGTAQLVEAFIVTGCPSSREQNIDGRRAGYIASTVLIGSTKTRMQVEDIELDAIMFRVVSLWGSTGNLPRAIYYHGGCSVSGGLAAHGNQLRQLVQYSGCRVITVQHHLIPEHIFPTVHSDAETGTNITWKYARKLDVSRSNITLVGSNVGGHLALIAALCLKTSE